MADRGSVTITVTCHDKNNQPGHTNTLSTKELSYMWLTTNASDCERCGSHGYIIIEGSCPTDGCKRRIHVTLRDW